MKKFYLSLLGAMLAMTAGAQDYYAQNGALLDSTYSVGADGARMSKTICEYDAKGNITVEYTYDYTGGKEQLSMKSEAEYDDQGRCVKTVNYEYQNGEFVLYGYEEMSDFDSEGRATVIIEYGTDEENPSAGIQPEAKTVVKKYNQLAMEDVELYSWSGSDWQLYSTNHSDFNDQGLPIKTTSTMSMMGMTFTNTVTMEYDDHGQVLRSETSSGFGVNTTQEYENSYDADGNLIKQTCKTMGIETTMFLFWSKGGSAGIGRVQAADGSTVYYDLNGRRLNGKPQQKGLYIRNGKKVMIR
ncbi:MAG: hypothetical protein IJ569_05440 [Prevotella sp.]|nr:hypothetical protein [Prevotella sp.]